MARVGAEPGKDVERVMLLPQYGIFAELSAGKKNKKKQQQQKTHTDTQSFTYISPTEFL